MIKAMVNSCGKFDIDIFRNGSCHNSASNVYACNTHIISIDNDLTLDDTQLN